MVAYKQNTVQRNRDILYYLTAVIIFLLLKFGFTLADNDDLIFLLKPTDKLVGFLTGSHSVYLSEEGYFHGYMNIIIDKSCSGFNFWVLSFPSFTYVMVKYFDRISSKILAIPGALILAYILTIFVNTSRIFASIIVQTHTKNIFPHKQHIIHEAIGIMTNLTFLILAYILIENFLKNKRYNAKFS